MPSFDICKEDSRAEIHTVSLAIVLSCFGLGAAAAHPAQQQTSPATATPSDIPVTPTPASQARAKEIYGYDCSMCHGANGAGNTDLDKQSSWSVPNLSDPATLSGVSDQELYNIIVKGKGSMPGDAARLKPEEGWNLVIYVRGLSGTHQQTENKPPVQ